LEGGKLSTYQVSKYEKYLSLVIELLNYVKLFNNETIRDFNFKLFIDTVYKFFFLLASSYPEFFAYYYFILINCLPSSDYFIQMKNIILHCAPHDIEQPDPFYDEFKVDSLPDIRKNSLILFDISLYLGEYKDLIDEYIETKDNKLLESIFNKLNNSNSSSNFTYINAIVIYWSQYVIKTISEKKKMSNSEVLEFFIKMMKGLDSDNRDHLINSILNELRYPSNQTYYFSCLLLCIFFEIKNEQIEEHILKNILERVLYKPYPWGIIVTFIELSRHPKYELFKKPYIVNNQYEKIIDDIVKFIKSSKLNKSLDNYIA
jgi:CCR4-NOT transcription complex subunit 1